MCRCFFCDLQLHLEAYHLRAQPEQFNLLSDDLLARHGRFDPVVQRLLDQPQFFSYATDAADLVGTLDSLLLELGRLSLFRDAFHVALPIVA